jgi:hypothetical protein
MLLMRSRAILAAATAGEKCGGSKYARGATFATSALSGLVIISACPEHAANEGYLKSFPFHLQVPDYRYGSNTQFYSCPPEMICSATGSLRLAASTTSLPKPAMRSLDRRSVDRGG